MPTLNQHFAQDGSSVTCTDDGCTTQSGLLLDRGLRGAGIGNQHSVPSRAPHSAARYDLRRRNSRPPLREDAV